MSKASGHFIPLPFIPVPKSGALVPAHTAAAKSHPSAHGATRPYPLNYTRFSSAFQFALADLSFALQSAGMETNQAAEHLQVIRTLMERSAIYRRALAPIMVYCGLVGIIAGIAGWHFQINSINGFIAVWYGSAFLALAGSLLLVRRQAFKESEPFWSAPTKRVAQAMLPPLVFGMVAGILFVSWVPSEHGGSYNYLIMMWAWLYGCALHSAGFSISRGVRSLGWLYGVIGCLLLWEVIHVSQFDGGSLNHLTMGGLFGGIHLLYGIYLYFTENRKTAP